MRVAIVGAGPTGTFTALALARRGHRVAVVDRDGGPAADGTWHRRGVMQFHQSHGYRPQVVDALRAEAPEVLDALVAAGARLAPLPGAPADVTALLCRRSVFDRILRRAALDEPGVAFRRGHADGVRVERGRATGVVVDGAVLGVDLVVDASGRSGSRLAAYRGPAENHECGVTYASREYTLRPGAEAGPVNSPLGMMRAYPRYLALLFLHDGPTFSLTLITAAADRGLRALREPAAFDAVARAIPDIAAWTDPARAEPLGPVHPGGGLRNTYRGQCDESGAVALPGLVAVGDAVCTTTPLAGRGLALCLPQAREFARLVDEHPADPAAVALALDAWSEERVRPWFDDHVHGDADRIRRWAGGDVDTSRRLPSELIVAAAEADPSFRALTGPYEGMLTLPETLEEIEPQARKLYLDGWRPAVLPGPSREELVEICERSRNLTQPHLTWSVPSMPKWYVHT